VPRVLVPLAPGFEEIEAVTIVDVLRRGGVEVVVAGLGAAGAVVGSHGIAVQADTALADVVPASLDMIVLPGGEPGTTHLAADARLGEWIETFAAAGRPLGAICAAPRLLAARGLLRARPATSHPSVEQNVRDGGAEYRDARVVRAGAIVTSRGPGTALEFALAVLDVLGLAARAAELRRAMLVAPSPADRALRPAPRRAATRRPPRAAPPAARSHGRGRRP
jgi:4-methyl-5(b-hydroxyethyl)-thiazole monophosphate biosynthesis